MKRVLILICILSIVLLLGVSCNKKIDRENSEELFDKDEVVFNCEAKDTTLRINGTLNWDVYLMTIYDDETADTTVSYDVYGMDKMYGEWFTITLNDDKVNIVMLKNQEDHERQIRLVFFRAGSWALVVRQRHCL
ncbi:MAG: hypothetical protein ACLUDU_21525 [Butyricimonas faecihominis]